MRFALYLATFMYAVFGVLDAVIAPEQKVVFWIIRYAFVIPGTLIVILWSFRSGFQKVSMPVLTVLGILGGLGIEIMIALAEPPAVYSYYAGIILVFITVHVLFGMHVVWAGICSITIVLCYEIIAIWVVDTPVPILVNNNFFFISSCIICNFAGYIIELNSRKKFFSTHMLSIEKEKVVRINRELDGRVRERTRELSQTNTLLEKEIKDRIQAESARLRLEKELNQKQKLEAVGTLAGGIAHDFNNILAAVIGYTELAMSQKDVPREVLEYMTEVFNAAVRAKDLTKQILAFSRQSDQEARPVHVRPIVEEAFRLVRATLPATVEIRTRFVSDAWIVCDPTQFHRIVVNLCTNSVQAMKGRTGVLEILLSQILVDETELKQMDLAKPGSYLVLEIRDTGQGIDPEIINKIFDPFFTTKEVGQGTGMGLSVVHGVVKQYGGSIRVKSQLGKGTTFTLLFPETCERESGEMQNAEIIAPGAEQILILDDEPALATLMDKTLSALGYRTVSFTNSAKAIAYAQSRSDSLDLIITDYTMPGYNGIDVAEKIRHRIPGIPVILCTGYNQDITPDRMKQAGISAFLIKPVLRNLLVKTVRQVLDGAKKSPRLR